MIEAGNNRILVSCRARVSASVDMPLAFQSCDEVRMRVRGC